MVAKNPMKSAIQKPNKRGSERNREISHAKKLSQNREQLQNVVTMNQPLPRAIAERPQNRSQTSQCDSSRRSIKARGTSAVFGRRNPLAAYANRIALNLPSFLGFPDLFAVQPNNP